MGDIKDLVSRRNYVTGCCLTVITLLVIEGDVSMRSVISSSAACSEGIGFRTQSDIQLDW